jgi:hypothetical protein
MTFNYDTDNIIEKEMELFDPDYIAINYRQFLCYNEEFDNWFNFIHITLPQSNIKWVKFGVDFNNSLDDLPDDIEYIYFDDATNFNQKVNKFPKNLKKITLWGFNPIINQLPYTLKYLELHNNNYNDTNTFYYDGIINFPPNLIALYISRFNINTENYNYLPITLKSLHICTPYNSTKTINLNNLPPGLKYLYIYGNNKISIDCNNLPDNIEQLILYGVYTNIYKLPKSLKYFDLDIDNPFSEEIKKRFPDIEIELRDFLILK